MEYHSTPTPKLSGWPQQPPRQPAKFLRCLLTERPWLRQFNEERSIVFRAGHDTSLPESEVPSPGRWVRSGRHAGCGIDHALRRLSRPNPLRIPSGGGLLRRPRTEASPRRVWMERRGIGSPRPRACGQGGVPGVKGFASRTTLTLRGPLQKYQSGETDRSGRISKIGDASVRAALYQAAHVILTEPVKGCPELKSWGMRLAKRAGQEKAKVALARKLAVIMHRMLADGIPFNPNAKAERMAATAIKAASKVLALPASGTTVAEAV